jgi:hypothetical protein
MNNFKTNVDLFVFLDRTDNHGVESTKFNLRWNLELEMRDYGVKSFIITVPEQTVTIDVTVWGEDGDTVEPLTLEIKNVCIEHSGRLDQIVPSHLEYIRGQWTLNF